MRTRRLKKYLQTLLAQTLRENTQRVQQRLTTRNNDSLRSTRLGASYDSIYIYGRKHLGIPRIFGITPTATHIATTQADEVCRLTRMITLTLNGIEVLYQRQLTTTIQHIIIRQ
jgi:hypothetical protein